MARNTRNIDDFVAGTLGMGRGEFNRQASAAIWQGQIRIDYILKCLLSNQGLKYMGTTKDLDCTLIFNDYIVRDGLY
jgi:hypothetical protein